VPPAIVGAAGHIDHGKTALVRALTGVDTARLPEEKVRGITIDPGIAELDCGEDVRLGVALRGREALGPPDFGDVLPAPGRHLMPLLAHFHDLGVTLGTEMSATGVSNGLTALRTLS
jgi:hypothetical protein